MLEGKKVIAASTLEDFKGNITTICDEGIFLGFGISNIGGPHTVALVRVKNSIFTYELRQIKLIEEGEEH